MVVLEDKQYLYLKSLNFCIIIQKPAFVLYCFTYKQSVNSLGFIPLESWMSVPNVSFTTTNIILRMAPEENTEDQAMRKMGVELFHWIGENFDLLVVRKARGPPKCIPLESMNVCTKFYWNQSNSCCNILVWITVSTVKWRFQHKDLLSFVWSHKVRHFEVSPPLLCLSLLWPLVEM